MAYWRPLNQRELAALKLVRCWRCGAVFEAHEVTVWHTARKQQRTVCLTCYTALQDKQRRAWREQKRRQHEHANEGV